MSYIHFLSKIFFLVKWIKGFLFWCGDLRNLVPFVKFQTVIHGVVTLLVSNTPLWVFSRPNNANHLILFPCKIKKSKKQSNYVQVSYITKGLWWHRYFLREASINKTKRHFTSFLARSYDTLNLKIALKIYSKLNFKWFQFEEYVLEETEISYDIPKATSTLSYMKTGTLALREGVFLCSQTHITNKLATYIGLILLLVFLNL